MHARRSRLVAAQRRLGGIAFVIHMTAAQEGNAVEDIFLPIPARDK
jgi:hypothetical protein